MRTDSSSDITDVQPIRSNRNSLDVSPDDNSAAVAQQFLFTPWSTAAVGSPNFINPFVLYPFAASASLASLSAAPYWADMGNGASPGHQFTIDGEVYDLNKVKALINKLKAEAQQAQVRDAPLLSSRLLRGSPLVDLDIVCMCL